MKARSLAALIALTLSIGAVPASATEQLQQSPHNEVNTAPVAENLEIATYRGVAASGRLTAVDPEGDPLTYTIVTEPRKGRIDLSVDGCFVYTPLEGKKGKDYFGFKACDSFGNYSQEATCIIKIEKQKTSVTYSDIRGQGAEYAAITLAERDIFVGERIGGSYIFSPDHEVSRGEFLAMCLRTADTELLAGVSRTGFADDSQMPAWVKPYVSTALMRGVVSGYGGTALPVFDAASPISYSEAAVVLNRVLELSDVAATTRLDAEYVPVWAYQATINLSACRVLPEDGISSMGDSVTRGAAAKMMLGAIKVLDSRAG